MKKVNAAEIHKTLQQMARHVAGEHNFLVQLSVMSTILGDKKLYAELIRRTESRLAVTGKVK